jgi:hypothetical protein
MRINIKRMTMNRTLKSVIITRSIVWFMHAECDSIRRLWFLHAECNFHTQCDVDLHTCDYDTHDCVILTRMSVITTPPLWVHLKQKDKYTLNLPKHDLRDLRGKVT